MTLFPRPLGERYSPLYFLSSVGAGGLAVTFFMYLMFWVPHAGRPVPVFEDIVAFWGTADLVGRIMVLVASTGIAFFAVMNLRLLIWNLNSYRSFRQESRFVGHQSSNAQTQIEAMPLALAMSVNAMFILGLVFVPQLWSVVEYLFPLAIIAFLAIGVLALKNMAAFLGRVLVEGGFDDVANNSFAQLLPAFAFAMVGVGLAAPSAMSNIPAVVGISFVGSTFFFLIASIVAVVAMVLGVQSMLKNGVAPEAAPTVLIIVPLLTVLGILMLRQNHGLHTSFELHSGAVETFVLLTQLLSVQVIFGLLGLLVLRKQGYATRYLNGNERSAGAYALICPGVALSVMLQFFINKGLVAVGLIEKFSTVYWGITAIALVFQVAMIILMLRLNRQHFSTQHVPAAVAAE